MQSSGHVDARRSASPPRGSATPSTSTATTRLARRLAAYLDARAARRSLLVGEAAGYRGARVSGVPFTSERQLTGCGPAEATATIVHRVLAELGLSERRSALERRADAPAAPASRRTARRRAPRSRRGLPFARAARPRPAASFAVGRVAEAALGAPYVRHPSHGGAPAFRDDATCVPDLDRVDPPKHVPARLDAGASTPRSCSSSQPSSSLTFVLVTGVKGLLGLGPAIFLVCRARPAPSPGGRWTVTAACRSSSSASSSAARLRDHRRSARTPRRRRSSILGFVLTGSSSATSLLVRTAAGDMYPPERRARGISFVLFGSVFGAILGPTVFRPLFAGKELDADDAHRAVARRRAGSASARRRSSRSCGRTRRRSRELIAPPTEPVATQPEGARSREILRRPGVIPAMLAAFASFGVMVSVMNLTGYVVVEKHGHAQHDVFPIIGAHVLGMYALVLVVGALVDRFGRTPRARRGPARDRRSPRSRSSWIASVAGDGVAPLRARHRLEHLVRRRGGAARRSDAAVGARAALRLQRLRCATLVGASLALLGGADARDARRRRDGGRRRDPRHGACALDLCRRAATAARCRPDFATLRRRRTAMFAFSLP